MSLAVLRSRALAGMEALCVNVEVHLANGLPSLTMLGTDAPTKKVLNDCNFPGSLQNMDLQDARYRLLAKETRFLGC